MHLERPQLSAVWQTIDRERSAVADLIDDFSSDELATASLCEGWTVRDVAAHLTLAHTPPMTAVRDLVRARGSFDRMVHDTAVRHRAPTPDLAASLRRMVGSRRTAPMVTPVEPLRWTSWCTPRTWSFRSAGSTRCRRGRPRSPCGACGRWAGPSTPVAGWGQ
ncbi:maleylpyruvate isomerase family mycothiol-dependent enzyme [Luteipulveratus sp. YIM 133132]|uniref:maleylpyruvate isomerase family mycothiol-dependent enzyme n=1 Tax=Luteipulveratus flavus TaxID=3031728 RepID=UPI0023AE906B|nr:maleylpyruvate isomerase family mycothiol-dependent enzyme [Luteipulveratus sp. YIM 133132]MDE9367766.1 maleylpyruvate isomerase family mycothiol-dependent enzyme [Luteipulveratus sp. YIM 133132]